MANSSLYAAFERMWQHMVAVFNTKADVDHNHDDVYCTQTDIDDTLATEINPITDEEIDTIFGQTISYASQEVF